MLAFYNLLGKHWLHRLLNITKTHREWIWASPFKENVYKFNTVNINQLEYDILPFKVNKWSNCKTTIIKTQWSSTSQYQFDQYSECSWTGALT